MVWIDTDSRGVDPALMDHHMRTELGLSLPAGLPKVAYKRESNQLVEICAVSFPGASPVWVWEE